MNRIKHIWKYLTSPAYRFWVDFCTQQEYIDKSIADIQYNLKLQNHPMFISKDEVYKKHFKV